MNFISKLKKFFSNKLNFAVLCVTCVLIVLLLIQCNNAWYIRVTSWVLAIDLALLGWKMYLRHIRAKEIYDAIDSTTREEKPNSFGNVTGTFNSIERRSNLIYAICFFALAVVIVVYTFIK